MCCPRSVHSGPCAALWAQLLRRHGNRGERVQTRRPGHGLRHRLRHTAATEMLRAGAGLEEIGQILRHESLFTTAIYAKVDRVALRELARPWPGANEGAGR